ncbi:MAG: nucleoside deaminase [Bacteroidetes bacterium QH_2_64_26]|nr:MAG: nucleoside deaminase [Bacteroidetes bacterium QH_2_64_26]
MQLHEKERMKGDAKKTLPSPACNRSAVANSACRGTRTPETRMMEGSVTAYSLVPVPCRGGAAPDRVIPQHLRSPVSSTPSPHDFLREALEMAVQNVTTGQGGPFAALIVRDGTILERSTNVVTTLNDPTAHAEVMAIRRACDAEDHFELTGCTLYATCEPCPMCLGAAYWARLDRVYYAATREDAADAGFDDTHIYEEITKPPSDRRIPMHQQLKDEAQRPFDAWRDYEERVEY